MRLVERHEVLIERDANDISILWKLLQMLFYFVSAVAGYVSSYAFYIFQDSFNHRCILWATANLAPNVDVFFRMIVEGKKEWTEKSWQERLSISFKSELHCYSIQLISMLSCVCGVIGLGFFGICGRGGYNQVRVYRAPWRLVCPATILNFCLSLLTLETACDFDHGFENFRSSLNELLNRTGNEPMMEYIQAQGTGAPRVVWKYFQITKISSWIGTAAWILGLALLLLRVINVTDFRLLKVSKYTTKAILQINEPRGNEPSEEM